VKIEHHTPSTGLRPYIKTFIFIESDEEAVNFVMPDTAMVLAIRYSGHVWINENNTDNKLPPIVLSGIRQVPRYIKYSAKAGNLLVVFEPYGAAIFFKEPLHEFVGRSVEANYLKGYTEINNLAEQLSALASKQQQIAFVEQFLLTKLTNPKPDFLVAAAVQKIKTAQGNIRVKNLIDELSISRDAFEKRFRKTVGTQPKQFTSIIKLKNVINNHAANKTLTEVALDAGYYDQAHFIKEFKTLTGKTPGQFFANPVFW
jgi:AraC-like DNA-binding protein